MRSSRHSRRPRRVLLTLAALLAPVLAFTATDSQPPRLTGEIWQWSAGLIDVTDGPERLTLRFSVEDAPAGMQWGWGALRGPSDQWLGGATEARLVEGTPSDGVWEIAFEISRWSEPGYWTVHLNLTDAANNQREYRATDISALGLAWRLEVVNATPDVEPPALDGTSKVSSEYVSVSHEDRVVHLEFGVSDPRAGMSHGYAALRGPSGQYLGSSSTELVEGTNRDGTWEVKFQIPRHSEHGRWRIELQLTDAASNSRSYRPSDLADLGVVSAIFIGAPAGPPTDLEARPDPASVELRWRPPVDTGGVQIAAYVVYRDGEVVAELAGDRTTWEDALVVPGVAHRYAVASRNAFGTSEPSAEVCSGALGIPDAFPDLLC